MTGWRSGSARGSVAVAGSVVGASLGLSLWLSLGLSLGLPGVAAPAHAAEDPVPHRTVFSFTDPAIAESSGLVDDGDVVYTINDSGAGPVLYAVDPATGDTRGETTYRDGEVVDVEAIAPGRGGTVWVADTGDNFGTRDQVTVYRVRPGESSPDRPAPSYDLTYPDGPRDAETLLVHPRNGRLFVVSKTPFGGVVYAAPRRLDPDAPNRLRRFAQVPGLVTDGSFYPDGRHVLLRTYGTASVYTFPGFDLRGSVLLPRQDQGEGISVGQDGRVLISSEGVGAPVLEVRLPGALTADRPVESPAPPAAVRDPARGPMTTATSEPDLTDWLLAGGALLGGGVLAGGAAWLVRRRRTS